MQIAGAYLVAFQHQIVELDRTSECFVRRIGKAHAPGLRGAGQHVDDHASGKLARSRGRIAHALDQRVDRIDDVRAEKLRQDQIAVAIPLFFLLARQRTRRSAVRWQGQGVLHPETLRELARGGNLSR